MLGKALTVTVKAARKLVSKNNEFYCDIRRVESLEKSWICSVGKKHVFENYMGCLEIRRILTRRASHKQEKIVGSLVAGDASAEILKEAL